MIVEKAYAKINLALEVVGKREDGYHDLKMIMISLELHDILTFEDAEETKLVSNIEIEHNAVLKTIDYMKTKYKVDKNVKVYLEKNIPIGAGLGGGSADISATLRGLNQLWSLNLSLKDLETDANNLGSDTLFCLYNKPAYVYGRGEFIEFINEPEFKEIYLFYPDIEVSTAQVFKVYQPVKKTRNFDELLEFYQNKDYKNFFKNTYNDLHKTALSIENNLLKFDKTMKKVYKNAYMSGSGSTYFLINFDENILNFEENVIKNEIKYIKTASKQ